MSENWTVRGTGPPVVSAKKPATGFTTDPAVVVATVVVAVVIATDVVVLVAGVVVWVVAGIEVVAVVVAVTVVWVGDIVEVLLAAPAGSITIAAHTRKIKSIKILVPGEFLEGTLFEIFHHILLGIYYIFSI
jgi:hypothetical protein